MNEIVIRDFQTDDLSPLVHVLKRNIPTYFDPSEEAEFVTYIGKHSDTYFTALVNQQVAGGAGYRIDATGTAGYIRWIFFDPGNTRAGLGRAIVDRCTARLLELGAERIVAATSQLAGGFFAKLGFVTLRTEQDYWGKGLDLWLMEKKVKPGAD